MGIASLKLYSIKFSVCSKKCVFVSLHSIGSCTVEYSWMCYPGLLWTVSLHASELRLHCCHYLTILPPQIYKWTSYLQGLYHLQTLITCSMQKCTYKTWVSYHVIHITSLLCIAKL